MMKIDTLKRAIAVQLKLSQEEIIVSEDKYGLKHQSYTNWMRDLERVETYTQLKTVLNNVYKDWEEVTNILLTSFKTL